MECRAIAQPCLITYTVVALNVERHETFNWCLLPYKKSSEQTQTIKKGESVCIPGTTPAAYLSIAIPHIALPASHCHALRTAQASIFHISCCWYEGIQCSTARYRHIGLLLLFQVSLPDIRSKTTAGV